MLLATAHSTSNTEKGDGIWQNREQIVTSNYRHPSLHAPSKEEVILHSNWQPRWCRHVSNKLQIPRKGPSW